MRLLLRWVSNSLAFYLALYLVDSLAAPRFYIEKGWIAIVLAVILGILNSLIRPLHRLHDRPKRAWGVTAATVVGNALFIQLMIWLTAPISTTGLHWVIVVAIFLTVLGGAINWLIGFKPPKAPEVITRELRASRENRERERESRAR